MGVAKETLKGVVCKILIATISNPDPDPDPNPVSCSNSLAQLLMFHWGQGRGLLVSENSTAGGTRECVSPGAGKTVFVVALLGLQHRPSCCPCVINVPPPGSEEEPSLLNQRNEKNTC